MNRISNFIGFQIGWFSCVLGAAYGSLWLGPAVVVVLAALNLYDRQPHQRLFELRLLGLACLLGLIVDSLLAAADVFTFLDGQLPPWLSRPWMVALWANFALTLRSSMDWLQGRYGLAAVLGMISGPLAYWAGARLGAVELSGLYSLLFLAAVWLPTVPLLLWLSSNPPQSPAGETPC